MFEGRDDIDTRTCLWALKAANGSVDGAANYILMKEVPNRSKAPKGRGKTPRSPANGIDRWIKSGLTSSNQTVTQPSMSESTNVAAGNSRPDDGAVPAPGQHASPLEAGDELKRQRGRSPSDSAPLRSALSLLRWPSGLPSSVRAPESGRPLKKQRTLHPNLVLDSPEDVSTNLPTCTLIRSFLPSDMADALLRRVMADAQEWDYGTYVVGQKLVTANRRGGFYVEPKDKNDGDDASDELVEDAGAASQRGGSEEHGVSADDVPSANETSERPDDTPSSPAYVYQGRTVRRVIPYPAEMDVARRLVEAHVNEFISTKDRHPLEPKGSWKATAAVANHYANAKESVAWHGDRLNHIGPLPTVASITLGAARAFRLRKVMSTETGESAKTYVVVLKHGDFLMMGAGTQELYRHDVPPLNSSLPPLVSHPIAGTSRYNLTFRYYRPSYSLKHTPRCWCENPCDLRCVTKRTGKTYGRYFWFCAAAGTAEGSKRRPEHVLEAGKKCNFFVWLEDWQKKLKEEGKWIADE
ncbi:hypothetical protein M427DRAFT_60022 [Gonapodya prolifera JEL478]|uniref:Uncharacterized protein n=1 Tax=Gonapodya prolifera (strain JEL478) TaxID=1344416 RepID=A0A139A557_GONPJ|nr:hypothetical protein M427DRAFT_60022 [Gonapodya prolifera JEL478]|eukprot:KXS11874.1 hypothetical protein M427DRAFT_60022 [Gonapodya prolifera JEL478]